jgi:hypothetical protein
MEWGAMGDHDATLGLDCKESQCGLEGTEMNTNAAERVADVDETSLEGQIREFVRKDNPPIHGSMEASESAVNGVCSLVQRVAGTSLGEIDNMIIELQKLRVSLVSEGERLQRELAEYGKLTRATLRSSRIITDSLPSCKLISDRAGREYPAGEHVEP